MNDRGFPFDSGWDDGVYGTGSTQPPKSHRAVIALLLVTVIFLGGITTAMSILNIRLFRELHRKEDALTVAYAVQEQATEAPETQPPETQAAEPARRATMDIQRGAARTEGALSLQEIYEKNIPSVVSITSQTASGTSAGTGVIVSDAGYLVTNYHVVRRAQSIDVKLTDERELTASVVGEDPVSDLAVLYIAADGLTPAQFGDSDTLRVGDSVVAIGDPLGVELRGTMTDGIVSAISRDVQVDGRTMNLIQTNAALNSGNSGGPLINSMGQVVGINTMKIGAFADSSGVEGLGFAIPSATVQEIVNQLLTQGYVSGRPWLGIEGESFSTFYQRFYRIPRGVYITSVQSGSPAGTAGLQSGDIIVSVDGTAVSDMEDLDSLLYAHIPGDTMTLTIYRSGRQGDVTVTLTEKQQ
ncbi:trypsin-like peptidase domain-containing protein [Pseudoflavonifractor sp. MSJ-30]|uniref:S1C family serine protease n=1 Tax=Pseudoflavonifractor sp. MSJ-30 TaxID=2841525 RepID=UPI001C0FA43E|nr:trypsin-like peptidase domain-containing protein [Pseudoflavonifractor sp. MSJ-30]MBU5451659.1 trypsin-like peptidase domain-containing protein [Pseudoflavonifractor sp. MSJ-30]